MPSTRLHGFRCRMTTAMSSFFVDKIKIIEVFKINIIMVVKIKIIKVVKINIIEVVKINIT